MKIEQKDKKTIFTYKDMSIKLLELEKNLFRIKISGFDDLEPHEKMICKGSFIDYCQLKNLSILTEENTSENNYLLNFGFTIFRSKTLYYKKLESKKENSTPIRYKSLQEVSEAFFIKTFVKSVFDYEEKDGYSDVDYFEYLKGLAEDKYNDNWWKLAFLNDEPIGVILPQIFPDNEKEGTLYYIGLIEKYRNKGYGKRMHLDGLHFLNDFGATDYFGSTINSNLAMKKVFEVNDCKVEAIQNFFRLEDPKDSLNTI